MQKPLNDEKQYHLPQHPRSRLQNTSLKKCMHEVMKISHTNYSRPFRATGHHLIHPQGLTPLAIYLGPFGAVEFA